MKKPTFGRSGNLSRLLQQFRLLDIIVLCKVMQAKLMKNSIAMFLNDFLNTENLTLAAAVDCV